MKWIWNVLSGLQTTDLTNLNRVFYVYYPVYIINQLLSIFTIIIYFKKLSINCIFFATQITEQNILEIRLVYLFQIKIHKAFCHILLIHVIPNLYDVFLMQNRILEPKK